MCLTMLSFQLQYRALQKLTQDLHCKLKKKKGSLSGAQTELHHIAETRYYPESLLFREYKTKTQVKLHLINAKCVL